MSLLEANAEHVRGLQSALMVAALKCVHRPELETQEKYNTIVQLFDRELIAHSNVLQGYFKRTYGSRYRYHLNKYVTRVANDYSLLTFEIAGFCDKMAGVAAHILEDGTGAILNMRFDRSFLPANTVALCESKASRDVRELNGTVPDLADIHMPDINEAKRPKPTLPPSLTPPMPAE